jgi:hypothetical protein
MRRAVIGTLVALALLGAGPEAQAKAKPLTREQFEELWQTVASHPNAAFFEDHKFDTRGFIVGGKWDWTKGPTHWLHLDNKDGWATTMEAFRASDGTRQIKMTTGKGGGINLRITEKGDARTVEAQMEIYGHSYKPWRRPIEQVLQRIEAHDGSARWQLRGQPFGYGGPGQHQVSFKKVKELVRKLGDEDEAMMQAHAKSARPYDFLRPMVTSRLSDHDSHVVKTFSKVLGPRLRPLLRR